MAAQSSISACTGPNTSDVEMTSITQSPTTSLNLKTPLDSATDQIKSVKTSVISNIQSNQTTNDTSTEPCALCMTEEKNLACIPCGHLSTCVACGHSVRTCPICRQKIDAYVRIYI